ncbi:MAG: T9SS type A sorting domain-containing protein [Bacteroidota bacterium]
MRKILFQLLATFFILGGSSLSSNAQVSLYDFTQSASTYTELTGATTLATATATTGTGSLDDINYTLANGTIPFNFIFDGVVYTGCTISSNGYLTFGTTVPTTTSYTPLSATTAYAGAIAALGGNLNAYFVSGNAAQTGSISYQTLGSTPNRKFVIQFKNFKPQAQGTAYTTAINFQIILNETSNAIDVIYNLTTGTYTSASFQVGLRGANNTYPANIKNRAVVSGTNTWSTSTNGTANTSTCGVSTSLLPTAGLTFRFAPTSCPSPTNLYATQITTNSAQLRWNNPVAGGSFIVEYGPVGFTLGTGTVVNTIDSFTTVAGLNANTSYSFYVQKSCGTGNNSLKIGPSSFTTGGLGEDCSTSQLLNVATSLATCSFTTVSTGVSINGPTSFCSDVFGNQATNDKWFKFVAPANGKKLVITTQAGTNNDWVMEVWTGCPDGGGYQIKCGDDQNLAMPEIAMCQNEYTAGQTYYVRVWTYTPYAVGTMSICIYETTMCAVPPANDNCANAIRLSVNPPLSCATNARTFLNNYATKNTDAASCDASTTKSDVWFVFNTGNFSDVDLNITALTAANLKAQLLFECGGFEIACWNPGTGTRTISGLNPQADYILRVWTDSVNAGTFSICITDRCSNPTATMSGSYSTCTGSSVSIPVTFTGTAPFALTYSNGTTTSSVTGITTSNYNLVVTPSASSTYTLTAMNDATCIGSASGSASVTVITPQTVTLNAFAPICSNAPLQLLSGGSPSGGVFSGVGVLNGYFNPAYGTQTITYTVTYASGCTRSASQVFTVNPLPTVTLSSFNNVCNTVAPFSLTGGSPLGGTYVGTGVSNNVFSPSVAGIGTFVITYHYTTPDGCTASDTSSITVTNCSVCANPPTANAGVDKTICYNATASITGSTTNATSLTWSGGNGTYSPNNTSATITYTPSASEITAGIARLILTTNDPDGTGPCVAATDTVIITIIAAPVVGSITGTTSVCKGQTGIIYSVVAQAGVNFSWAVPTGVSITAGQGTNSITTTWGSTSVTGAVTATITTNCGTSTGNLNVTVNTSPTAPTITGSTSVCKNQTAVVYSVTAQAGTTYTWTVPTGVTITAGQGTNSITTTWGVSAVSGNVGISIANTCGTTTGSLNVTVGSAPATPSITGSSAVCINQTGVVYSVTAQVGTTYTWTVPSGVTITAGQGTNSITTTWGSSAVSGNVGISIANTCGTSSGSLAVVVGIGTSVPAITGSTAVCTNQTGVVYSVASQSGATYTWTVPTGVTITAGQGTNSITTTWSSTGGNVVVSVTNTCGTSTGSLSVAIGATPTAPTVSGSATVCLNQSNVIYSVAAQSGVSYNWIVPSGVIITAGVGTNNITTTWSSSAISGNVYVALTNSCGTANGSFAVSVTPSTVISSIVGSTSLCLPQNQITYSVTSQAGVIYQWTVPSGVTILSGQGTSQIVTTWTTSAVSGNVSVVASGACNNASSSLPVVVTTGTLTVGTISGTVGICASTTGNMYSVLNQTGVTYNWTLPTGGTITSGQGTNSINVSWSSTATGGDIKVIGATACKTDSSKLTTVLRTAAPTQPSVITGNTTMCTNDSAYYYISKSAVADYYTWVPDTGMTINGSAVAISIPDTMVKVVFNSAFTGDTIKVRAGNCKGVGAYRVLKISSRTTVPSAITLINGQSTGLCGVTSVTYSITASSGATNYTWRTNITGAKINGQSVSTLTVDGSILSVTISYPTSWVGSGNIYVKANNGCGSTAEASLAVSSIVPTPGTITGNTSVCPNQTGVVYSIVAQSGVSYNWTVPNGVTITSGQGTNSITTTWTSTAVAGNVTVTLTSACGTSSNTINVGLASGSLSVGPITGNASNCKNSTGIIYSIPVVSGATYAWTVPTGVTITAGAGTNSITTSWSSTAIAGNVSVTATTTCSSGSATLAVGINSGLVVGTITGNTPICRPATGVVYSVTAQAGVTYVWTVPTGVTITAGAGTNSITTSWSSTSVTSDIKIVGTSSCGVDSTIKTITVRTAVPTQPSTVTGAASACIGDALKYSISKVATADYYVWTPKAGMLVNGSATALTTTDTAVTVTFTTGFVGDTLKVNAGNCKGLSTVRTKVISKNTAAPTTPGTITGQTTGVCGSTYTYSFASAVANATSYTWRTKVTGALMNGQAVQSITLAAPIQSVTITYPIGFTTDTLFVKSNNGCGSSAERTLVITAKPATPGAITTPTTLCYGTTVAQVFSIGAVTGATSYTWTYPSTGTTYVSGQGSTNLSLYFTASGSKAITVKATNACGTSSAKSTSVNPSTACPTARDGSAFDLSGIVVYPNPTQGNVTVAYTATDNSEYVLTVLDMAGREVERLVVNSIEGYNQTELNLQSLVKGTYIIALKGNGLVTQTRLIVE